jgi:hypothetical protein
MISEKELLRDIENTKKEYDAYCKIVEAYKVLSNLPENKNKRKYILKIQLYEQLANDCHEFYNKLRQLWTQKYYVKEKLPAVIQPSELKQTFRDIQTGEIDYEW